MRPVAGKPQFTLPTAFIAWVVTFVGGAIVAGAVAGAGGVKAGDDRPAWLYAVSAASIWVFAVGAVFWASRKDGTGDIRADVGLRWRPVDLIGLLIGVLCQLVLLELVYAPLRGLFPGTFARDVVEEPGRTLIDTAQGGWAIVLGLTVMVGAPIVEEMLYRGVIFRALEARIAAGVAVGLSAIWFAAAHFQPVQTPGLFAFGIVLAVCAWKTDRLGMAILAHAAFNATAFIRLLAQR